MVAQPSGSPAHVRRRTDAFVLAGAVGVLLVATVLLGHVTRVPKWEVFGVPDRNWLEARASATEPPSRASERARERSQAEAI